MDDTRELGRTIRALLDDYIPPPDPYSRVARRVRVRRGRTMAAGMAATATVSLVFLAAAATLPSQPSHGEAFRSVDAGAPPVAVGTQLNEIDDSAPGPAYVVRRGAVAGRSYAVASTTFGLRGAACLFAADAVFTRLSWCSTRSSEADLGEWDLLASRTDADAVAVGGTVKAGVRTVIIKARDGRLLAVPAVQTPTSARLAFFVGVLSGDGTQIAGVTATDADGRRIPLPRSVPDGRCAGGDPQAGSVGRVSACSSSGLKR
jgi:hypothetical protein